MNEELLKSCIDVSQIIIRRPIIKFFWSNCSEGNLQSIPPFSFETICIKLEKKLYSTYNDWIIDVHKLFDFHIKNNQNQLYQCAAKQLKLEFDELTSKFASNISIRLDKLKHLELELKDLATIYESEITQYQNDIQPGAEIFNIPIDLIKDPIKVIKRNISLFNSPEMILRITAILYKLQPETILVNGEQIRIEFALMKSDTIQGLLRYTIYLLNQIALGKIDPYSNIENSRTICSHYHPKQK